MIFAGAPRVIEASTPMRKFFTEAMGSVLALAGFAGAAGASATIDLIWIDVSETNAMGNPVCLLLANRNCAPDPRSPDSGLTISSVAVTDNITLGVILTAGPNGSIGGGVSVNYGDALSTLGVAGFQSLTTTQPFAYLTLNLGTTTDQSPYINNINAAAAPPLGNGTGLPAGVSAYLGTIRFHEYALRSGSFEISVGTDGPGGTDGVLDGVGNEITSTTTFNSAFLVSALGPTPAPTATPAAAKVDLVWIDVSQTDASGDPICLLPANRNCAPDPRSPDGGVTISGVAVTDNITLGVILTPGPNGSIGGGVSVNYGDAVSTLGVVGFQSLSTTQPFAYLPLQLGTTTDQSPHIDNINAAAAPPLGYGVGLPAGVSAYLGTITFHKERLVRGAFEISVGTDGPGGTDAVLDGIGGIISDTAEFNSAFLVNVTGPTPTPTATPTATPVPTPTAIPTPTSTPTATPIPTPTPVPTAPPTWPPRQRGEPPLDLSCLCEIENINPNQVVLKNVGTRGRGSETTRKMVMNLTAVNSLGAYCNPGESSPSTWINLEMVDDDGDVLVDHSERVTCEGGGVTTTVKWDVFFQGPLNCENGAIPPPKPGFSTGTIAIRGSAPLRPYYYESTRIKCFE